MAAVENYFMRDTIRDIPVYLLSVAGEKRTGKSFLMNYMIRALKCQVKEFNLGGDDETLKGFEWKSGTLGTTKGVWIWSEPFIMESNGKKVALFLLDSEGLMDIENNRNISTKLFSLVMLLSTHLIYNVKNGIDEKEMDYLEIYLHQAAQRAEKNKQTQQPATTAPPGAGTAVQTPVSKSQHMQSRRPSPGDMHGATDVTGVTAANNILYNTPVWFRLNFMFQYLDIVVRDWHDCENCGSKAANSYLKEQVEILRKKSSISPAVLEALENPNTKCFLMPYPGKKIAKSNTGIVKDMDEDFQKSLKGYLESVIKRPKNPSKTGAELAEMLKGIIGDLQGLDFEFSSPQEMSDKYLNSKEMRTTLEEFQQFLLQLSSIKLPGAMRECISGKSLELVKNFEKSVRGNNADMRRDLVGQLRTTLQKEGDTFYSNYQWQGIKYACSALLLASGPVGGMMFAGEAAVAATTTGFLPTAISYGQYVTALIAGRFLGRWL
ncbi:hypothetical protein XELAEV_18020163mg [Xenopus laevis]|uniref:GB1/RHD3-type G domain-containing protein n=1 Tax=Xenopus laevis TaxID=8355 RepID=A0A974HQE0_XENLA|nr:hypothetical protein XELAEV_18020163mg [Xenopus laevis]